MEIKYTKGLKIKNLSYLPKGLNCNFLEVIEGLEGDFIAKAWRRNKPTQGIFITWGA